MPNVCKPPFFGRKRDLDHLKDRVRHPGVTIVTSRPQMGKTLLLKELRDSLLAQGTSDGKPMLVGYAVGSMAETDLLLRSVEDLYRNWLSDSSLRQRAGVFLRQHKDNLLGNFANGAAAVGLLLVSVAGAGPVAAVVSSFFCELRKDLRDFKTGEIGLTTLGRNQVRDLLGLVHEATNESAVLVLDAIEQLPNPAVLGCDLKIYLDERQDWPPVHFLLACRAPANGEREDAAYQAARELESRSEAATIYPLGSLSVDENTTDGKELLSYIRREIPAAEGLGHTALLKLLRDHPGTISRWMEHPCPQTAEELKKRTDDALAYQYPELEPIFHRLFRDNRPLFDAASRAVLLPETMFCGESSPFDQFVSTDKALFDQLVDEGLLLREGADAACSFGHTVRYEQAGSAWLKSRIWCNERQRIAANLVDSIAAAITAISPAVAPRVEALLSLGNPTLDGCFGADAKAFLNLIRASHRLSQSEPTTVAQTKELITRHPEWAFVAAASMITIGNFRADAGNHESATEYYGAVADLPVVPAILRAGARVNLAKVYSSRGQLDQAVDELRTVVGKADLDPGVAFLARVHLASIELTRDNRSAVVANCNEAIDIPSVSPGHKAIALVMRGTASYRNGDMPAALVDFSAAIEAPLCDARTRVTALANRSGVYLKQGNLQGTIADCKAVVETPGAPTEMRAKAWANLGTAQAVSREFPSAIDSFTKSLGEPGCIAQTRARVLINRAEAYQALRDVARAAEDYDAVIGMSDAPDEPRYRAQLLLLRLKGNRG